jgi:surface antigen
VDAPYAAPPGYIDGAVAAAPPPPPAYGPQGAPTASAPPHDNSRGFYLWPVGIEGGTCNRAYLQQTASNLSGVSLRPGAFMGGITIAPAIGGRVGARLDITDQACATESLERAKTGQTISWQTASGAPITLQVTRTAQSDGVNCRDYVATAVFGSHTNTVSGKACKQQNGSWVAAG